MNITGLETFLKEAWIEIGEGDPQFDKGHYWIIYKGERKLCYCLDNTFYHHKGSYCAYLYECISYVQKVLIPIFPSKERV